MWREVWGEAIDLPNSLNAMHMLPRTVNLQRTLRGQKVRVLNAKANAVPLFAAPAIAMVPDANGTSNSGTDSGSILQAAWAFVQGQGLEGMDRQSQSIQVAVNRML